MISNSLLQSATQILKHDEGLRLHPYRDTGGFWTIGVGRFIGKKLEELTLSKETVEQMLHEDICTHWQDTVQIFGKEFLEKQTEARQLALLSLVFSLGKASLMKFIHTLPAIKNEQWDKAADLLLNTKWARDVDPKQIENQGRDDRIAFMIREGKFHEDYKLS